MQLHQLITELTELQRIVGPHAPSSIDLLGPVAELKMTAGGVRIIWEGDNPFEEIERLDKEVEQAENALDAEVSDMKCAIRAAVAKIEETKDNADAIEELKGLL